MENREFVRLLEKRTLKFAIAIIKLSSKLPHTTEGKVIRNQITKSGTSMGASYREANRARSKPDFRNKIKICESEASETLFWLAVILEMNWLSEEEVNPLYLESGELLAIFTTTEKNKITQHITNSSSLQTPDHFIVTGSHKGDTNVNHD